MKLKSAYLTILFSLLFAACIPQPNVAPSPNEMMALPSATTVQAETAVSTAAPMATVVKAAAALPTGSAVPEVTSEPTATPPAAPSPEIDPNDLARQILEQSEFAAAEGWLVTPCEGEAADNQSLSPLPPLTSYSEQNGELPGSLVWNLKTELPQAPAAVPVLSQPAQTEPLTAEQANRIAINYGFNGPLYVEARPGLSVNDAADLGLFATFDGARTLSLAGRPYSYSDISNWHQGLDLPFNEAAPIAEQFLRAKGWLTFLYTMAESTQGEGVLFLPIVKGVQLLSPANGVRVAGNGQVSDVSIYALDTLTPAGKYPIMTANMAWASLEKKLNQSGTFYRIKQPAVETTAFALPIEYSKFPSVQQEGEFFTKIWAYRPLTGDFPPIVRSIEFVRIAGDADMLNELVEKSDYLLHLWGRVDRPAAGLRELSLSNWEAIEDAGGLPMFFGTIRQDGYQTFLVDEANHTSYFLPDAPVDLEAGNYVAVSGLPETAGDMEQLLWQKITVYPPQPEAVPQPTAVAMQTINIGSVKLVYLPQPASVTGLSDNLFIPAWEFAGAADNGADVTVWVTAVSPEFIAK